MVDGEMILPRRSLIALCGPAGAGKSTFAREFARRNGLAATAVVSSDTCRLQLCDAVNSVKPSEWPTLQTETFELFLTIIGMRMSMGRPILADTVNLYMELRPRLLKLAKTNGYPTSLIVFDMSLGTCLSQNAQRDTFIPEDNIREQRQMLDEELPRLTTEGWDHVAVLNDQRRMLSVTLDGP